MFCHILIDRGSHVGDADWMGTLRSKEKTIRGTQWRRNQLKWEGWSHINEAENKEGRLQMVSRNTLMKQKNGAYLCLRNRLVLMNEITLIYYS